MTSPSHLIVCTDWDGCDVLDEAETFIRNTLAGYRCSISVVNIFHMINYYYFIIFRDFLEFYGITQSISFLADRLCLFHVFANIGTV